MAGIRNLRRLRELGCKIAFDDFGTGHCDLALLGQFRFDSLKLAPLFVADLPGNEYNAAIAEAVIGLARRLGLRTVAVGVSNAEQVRLLQGLGCDQIQGEWISPPVPADPCAALIRSRQASQASQAKSHRNPATWARRANPAVRSTEVAQ